MRVSNKNMKKKPIIVLLGVEITQERLPHLYRIAETSPQNVEAMLREGADGSNEKGDLEASATRWEHDFEHERLSAGYTSDTNE